MDELWLMQSFEVDARNIFIEWDNYKLNLKLFIKEKNSESKPSVPSISADSKPIRKGSMLNILRGIGKSNATIETQGSLGKIEENRKNTIARRGKYTQSLIN